VPLEDSQIFFQVHIVRKNERNPMEEEQHDLFGECALSLRPLMQHFMLSGEQAIQQSLTFERAKNFS